MSSGLGILQDPESRLEKQADALAEGILQHQGGLDLLLMKQGGLGMALG